MPIIYRCDRCHRDYWDEKKLTRILRGFPLDQGPHDKLLGMLCGGCMKALGDFMGDFMRRCDSGPQS